LRDHVRGEPSLLRALGAMLPQRVEESLLVGSERRSFGDLRRALALLLLAAYAWTFALAREPQADRSGALHDLPPGGREERHRVIGRREIDEAGGEERAHERHDEMRWAMLQDAERGQRVEAEALDTLAG